MAPVASPTRPIIVCGMARSGTSLLGEFIKTSPDVVIFPELDPASTPAIFELLRQVGRTLGFPSWRPFTECDVEARVVELLRNIWGSGRDWDVHDDTGQRRFGLKQPNAEELHEDFAAVLGEFSPQWVYAIRKPAVCVRCRPHRPRSCGAETASG